MRLSRGVKLTHPRCVWGGFTLLEVVIAIAVVGMLGVMLSDTLIQTLRVRNKTRVVNQIKQNGQVVMDKIEKILREQDKVVGLPCSVGSPAEPKLLLYKKSGGEQIYSLVRFVPKITIGTSKRNGYAAVSYFVNPSTPLTCPSADPTTAASTEELNSQTDFQNGVSVEGGSFAYTPTAGFKDQVTVSFKVEPGIDAGLAPENLGPSGGVEFKTTIQLR